MANYIFAFHGGGMPATKEDQDAVMAKWGQWMGGLGDALVNPGAPVGMSMTVHADRVEGNGGANPLSGFTVVEAASMDAAVEMAKNCPILDNGGSVEIAEAMKM